MVTQKFNPYANRCVFIYCWIVTQLWLTSKGPIGNGNTEVQSVCKPLYRLDDFFQKNWLRVNPSGGFLLVHNTLTNNLTQTPIPPTPIPPLQSRDQKVGKKF